MLFGFISSHKEKNDSSIILETEKELSILKNKKDELEKAFKELENNEKIKNLEYNELRQKIEKEKDSNRDAEKNVFRIIARQNEIRGQLNGIKNTTR